MKEYIAARDEDGELVIEREIVRCKDCKHRPIMPKDHIDGFDLKFPDEECPCKCEDGWYSWYPEDNWFCANGEWKGNIKEER